MTKIWAGDPWAGRLKLLQLAYLLMYPLPWLSAAPGESRPTAVAVAASALGIAAFLVLYFRGYGATTWPRLACAFAMLAIGLALEPFGGVWSVFAVYAASLCGFARPAWLGATGVVAVLSVLGAFGLALRWSPWDWGAGVFFGAIVGIGAVFVADIAERNQALAAARDETRRFAVLAERERIARDLHDLLGHTLTLVAVKADLARRLIDSDAAAARREIEEIHTAARAALADVRAAVSGMRSTTLAAELSAARRAFESAGIIYTGETTAEPLPPQMETTLAYVIREAATNVIRHSGARHCRITLACAAGEAALEIVDDGCGAAGCGGRIVEGQGVGGMRQRLAALRGALELHAESGLRLLARIPLEDESP